MSAHPARVGSALSVAQSPLDGRRLRASAVMEVRSRIGVVGGNSSRILAPRAWSLVLPDDDPLRWSEYRGNDFARRGRGRGGSTEDRRERGRGGSTARYAAIGRRHRRGGGFTDAARRPVRRRRWARSPEAGSFVDSRSGCLQAVRAFWESGVEGEEEEEKKIVDGRWPWDCRRERRWTARMARRCLAAENRVMESVITRGEGGGEGRGENTDPAGEDPGEAVNSTSPKSFTSRAGDPVLVIPGFLADAYEFVPLALYLRSLGFNALVAPIRWYHWVPVLGGRSIRPILDRIEATIAYALKNSGEGSSASGKQKSAEGLREMESLSPRDMESCGEGLWDNEVVANKALPAYTFADFISELRDPRKGSQSLVRQRLASAHASQLMLENGNGNGVPGQIVTTEGLLFEKEGSREEGDDRRVALVAHSAAGWISRILMGSRALYDGRIYGLARRVKVLLTLGTPHMCTDKLTKRNLDFVNRYYPGTTEELEGVKYVCVAGKAKVGEARFGGLLQDFAYQSYVLCCGQGDVWGDGITPVECALGLTGAEHLLLDGVQHSPAAVRKGGKWYGSPGIVEQWVPYIDAFREGSKASLDDEELTATRR